MILENTFEGYADDSTFLAEVFQPRNWVKIASSRNRKIACIDDRCKNLGMLINPKVV